VLTASEKILGPMDEKRVFGRRQYFSFVPPGAGMFIWMKINLKDHPSFIRGDENEETLEQKFFVELAEAGLLIGRG
jgi:aromatic amino acid aminotransferase I